MEVSTDFMILGFLLLGYIFGMITGFVMRNKDEDEDETKSS